MAGFEQKFYLLLIMLCTVLISLLFIAPDKDAVGSSVALNDYKAIPACNSKCVFVDVYEPSGEIYSRGDAVTVRWTAHSYYSYSPFYLTLVNADTGLEVNSYDNVPAFIGTEGFYTFNLPPGINKGAYLIRLYSGKNPYGSLLAESDLFFVN